MEKDKLSFFLRIFLSAAFLLSAYSKIIAPGLLEIILVDHGIAATRESASILVRILIGAELALALLLLQKNYLRIILSAISLFLAAFTAYLGYVAVGLKDSQNCGCFGAVIQMSPLESIIKNIFLIAAAVIAFKRTKSSGNKIILPLIFLLVSVPAVFLLAPPKENNKFIFSKYTSFINGGRTDLAQGEKLIFLFSLDCDHCARAAKDIVELKKSYNLPKVYAFYFKENDVTVDSFESKTQFTSPYLILPGEQFFELIGQSPPRCYYIKEGVVKGFWDNNIKENVEALFKK